MDAAQTIPQPFTNLQLELLKLYARVLSVAISRRSKFYPIWQAVRNGDFDLLVTTDMLDEYAEI